MSILVVLTVLQVALALGSLRNDSATADEAAHIAAGWLKLVHGQLDFFPEQPPLMNSFSALPLRVAGYDFPPRDAAKDHWGVGHDYLFRSGYDSQRILILARMPTVILFVALAWTAFAFVARTTGSVIWGIAAFAILALSPNLLAHGRLATVDMAATFFCFASLVLLIDVVQAPSPIRGAILGVAIAAAILSKTSSVILLPYTAAVIAVIVMMKRGTRRLATALVTSAGAALATVYVVFLALADTASLTLPFRIMTSNVRAIADWYTGSHTATHFLLGRFSTTSWWHYYPVALFYKLTIPALILLIASVVAFVKRRPSFEAGCLFGFAALFLAAAMRSEIALGLRYVLPILPPLFCGALIQMSRMQSRKMAMLAAILIAWHSAESLTAYPSYIGYFNQMIGSHRNADRYLIDSNLDWGQDLRRLGDWARANDVDAIAVCYFGGGDVATDVGIPTYRIWNVNRPDVPRGMLLALSRHEYRVSAWPAISKESWRSYLQRRHAQYIATVGDSIVVYRLDAGVSSKL